eukprot:jgi/Ulvmu1/5546/UM023_0082.1
MITNNRYMGRFEKPGPSRYTSGMQQVLATQNSSQTGHGRPPAGTNGMGYLGPSQLSSGSHRVLPPMGSQISASNVLPMRSGQSQSQAQMQDPQGGPSQPTLRHALHASNPASQPAASQSQASGHSLPVAHQTNRLHSQGTLAQHSPAGSSQRRGAPQRLGEPQHRQVTPGTFAQQLLKRTDTASGSAGPRPAGNSAGMNQATPQRTRAEADAATDLLVAKIDDVMELIRAQQPPATAALTAIEDFRVHVNKQVCDSLQEQCSSLDCTAQLHDINAAIASLQKQTGAILDHVTSRRSPPRVLCHIGVQSTIPQRPDPQLSLEHHSTARRSAAVQVTLATEPAKSHKHCTPDGAFVMPVSVQRISGHVMKGVLCRSSPQALRSPDARAAAPRCHHSARKQLQLPNRVSMPSQQPGMHLDTPRRKCVQTDSVPFPAHPSPHRLTPCGSTQKDVSQRGAHVNDAVHLQLTSGRQPIRAAQGKHKGSSAQHAAAGRSSSPPASCLKSGGRRATTRLRAALVSAARIDSPVAGTMWASPKRAAPARCGRSGVPAPAARAHARGGETHSQPPPHLRANTGAAQVSTQRRRSHRAVMEATRASQRLREKLGAGRRIQDAAAPRQAVARARAAAPSRLQQPAPEQAATAGPRAGAVGVNGSSAAAAAGHQRLGTEIKSISPLSMVVPRQKRGRVTVAAGVARAGFDRVRSKVRRTNNALGPRHGIEPAHHSPHSKGTLGQQQPCPPGRNCDVMGDQYEPTGGPSRTATSHDQVQKTACLSALSLQGFTGLPPPGSSGEDNAHGSAAHEHVLGSDVGQHVQQEQGMNAHVQLHEAVPGALEEATAVPAITAEGSDGSLCIMSPAHTRPDGTVDGHRSLYYQLVHGVQQGSPQALPGAQAGRTDNCGQATSEHIEPANADRSDCAQGKDDGVELLLAAVHASHAAATSGATKPDDSKFRVPAPRPCRAGAAESLNVYKTLHGRGHARAAEATGFLPHFESPDAKRYTYKAGCADSPRTAQQAAGTAAAAPMAPAHATAATEAAQGPPQPRQRCGQKQSDAAGVTGRGRHERGGAGAAREVGYGGHLHERGHMHGRATSTSAVTGGTSGARANQLRHTVPPAAAAPASARKRRGSRRASRASRSSSQMQSRAQPDTAQTAPQGRVGDASAACQLFDSCRGTRAVAAGAEPTRALTLPSALKRSANADLAALVRQRKRECVALRRAGVYPHDSDDSLIIAAAVDVRER